MLSVKNLGKFVDGLDRWAAKTEQEVADVANGITAEAFSQVLLTSPQFSGDFTANWKYSINMPDRSFEELDLLKGRPEAFISGDMPARRYAISANKGKDKAYKIGDTFYLSNSSVHDEAYAVLIETGKINFRPGNQGATVATTMGYLGQRYETVGKAQATRLRRRKL